jgi:hypothetical protein
MSLPLQRQAQRDPTTLFEGSPETRSASGDENTPPEPFVDAEKAGDFLQLQPRRVLQLARQGKLPAYSIGAGPRKIWRFRLSELATAMLHSRQRSHVPEEI